MLWVASCRSLRMKGTALAPGRQHRPVPACGRAAALPSPSAADLALGVRRGRRARGERWLLLPLLAPGAPPPRRALSAARCSPVLHVVSWRCLLGVILQKATDLLPPICFGGGLALALALALRMSLLDPLESTELYSSGRWCMQRTCWLPKQWAIKLAWSTRRPRGAGYSSRQQGAASGYLYLSQLPSNKEVLYAELHRTKSNNLFWHIKSV